MAEPRPGEISLILGPMFSGKTTELIRRALATAAAGRPVLAVKYGDDNRYGTGPALRANGGVILEGSYPKPHADRWAPVRVVDLTASLESLAPLPEEMDVFVDEGQFYGSLPEVCEKWAAEGRRVHVAALDGTFARRPFGRIHDLIPRCENLTKLKAVCMVCGAAAAFTRKIPAAAALGPGAAAAKVIQIGGNETYQAVCRGCYGAQ